MYNILNIISPIALIEIILIIGALATLIIKNISIVRNTTLTATTLAFLIGCLVYSGFDSFSSQLQFSGSIPLLTHFHAELSYGIDGLSILFILLTLFIFPLCIFSIFNQSYSQRGLFLSLLLIEIGLIGVFSVDDLFYFFIFFELVLIPMMFVIGVWGPRKRKIRANYYFILYTLFGSLFLLFGLILIYLEIGSTRFYDIQTAELDPTLQNVLWLCFFIGFAVKVPVVPFHIWLPEAHVEAPTVGSVILAAVLLKMGGYGLLRICIGLFPFASVFFVPLINIVAIISILYASAIALIQIDMKRIIAYSSVAHMNFAVLGAFTLTLQGLQGSILLMLGHGFVSGALFFLVGMLYDRHHTKLVQYYGGLCRVMPIFAVFFTFFLFANISFPGTSNFIGELLVFISLVQFSPFLVFLALFSTFLTTAYSIWLVNRTCFGELKTTYLTYFTDLNQNEISTLLLLVLPTLLIGLYPAPLFDITYVSVAHLLQNLSF